VELAVENGIQSPGASGPLGASSDVSASSSEEELEAEAGAKEEPLKWTTVNGYNAAIAELYNYQVSMGLNTAPTFRGATLKALMKGLLRT
jgi:hypothetical protein